MKSKYVTATFNEDRYKGISSLVDIADDEQFQKEVLKNPMSINSI